MCVSKEKWGEKLIPTLFPQGQCKENYFSNIHKFKTFPAIVCNQMACLSHSTFYCNLQGKYGYDDEGNVYHIQDKV